MALIKLENSLVSFGFDEANGSLVEIQDKTTGKQHLKNSKYSRLFRVVAPSNTWRGKYADSHHGSNPQFHTSPNELTISYRSIPAQDGELPIEAMIRVVLPDNSTEAFFTIMLTNHGNDRIHEVRFPWIGGWSGIDCKDVEKGIAGCVPLDLYPENGEEVVSYAIMGADRRNYLSSAKMMLPFVDISGAEGGLSYINYSENPKTGGVVVENLDREPGGWAFSFSWVHMPFLENSGMWISPAIGIGVHTGDWHATADKYRTWANDWWKAPHSPDRLKASIGFQAVQIRTFEGAPLHTFSSIPQMAEDGLAYGVRDLCIMDPIAGLFMRPDEGDIWESNDPLYMIDDLRYSLAMAREMDVNVSVMMNYRLMKRRSRQYMAYGEDMVQRSLYGAPLMEDWTSCSSSHASFQSPYLTQDGVVLCQRCPGFVKRALDLTVKTLRLGFTSLFIDQSYDENPCLSESHGHRSPDDTQEASVDWIREAAAQTRAQSLDSYLIGEKCDPFMAQNVDVNWNWDWKDLKPEVFRYTFPESLICYVVDRQPEVLNKAFALGCLAALTTYGCETTLSASPEFGMHVKNLAELKSKTFDYVADAMFIDQTGLQAEGAYTGVFESDTHLAVVASECNKQASSVKLAVDMKTLERSDVKEAVLYKSDGSMTNIEYSYVDGVCKVSFELQPLEVGIVVFTTERHEHKLIRLVGND